MRRNRGQTRLVEDRVSVRGIMVKGGARAALL